MEIAQDGYVSIQEKWTQTITLKSLTKRVKDFKKVSKRDNVKKPKDFGVEGFRAPSSRGVRRFKFPEVNILRTRGHSFDEGVVIWPGKPEKREPAAKRLRYKPVLQISSQPAPPSAVLPLIGRSCKELHERILDAKNRVCGLQSDIKLQKTEVRKLKLSFNEDFQIHVLKSLILNLQNSPQHQNLAAQKILNCGEIIEEYVPTPISLTVNKNLVLPPTGNQISAVMESLPSPVKRPLVESHRDFQPSILQRLGEKISSPIKKKAKLEKEVSKAKPVPSQSQTPSAVQRLRQSFAEHQPIPLSGKRSNLQKKPLATIVKEMLHPAEGEKLGEKKPKRRIRPIQKLGDAELLEADKKMESMADEVTKNQKHMDDFVASLFGPITPPRENQESIEAEELDKGFMDFEFLE